MYHKANLQALKIDLIKWSDEYKLRNTSVSTVNDMFQELQTVLESAMNCHIPTEMITKRNQRSWINRRIKRLHKRKQRPFNSASYEMFSNRGKSHIQRIGMLIEDTFRPFILGHRKDSGRTSRT